jgi:hypothetical protein
MSERGSSIRSLVAGAGLCLLGCSLGGGRPVQSVAIAAADRGTCEGLYVQSIWKGEDISGPECASYTALTTSEPEFDPRRVQKVCEQTQIRTILSGEPSTRFTLQACAVHEPRYQQARLGKACKEVSRARTRAQEDLTPAQSAVCKTYLSPESSSAALRVADSRPGWGNGLATVAESAREGSSASLAASLASGGAASAAEGAEPVTCEDRYVESIWKGVDVTGGPECAGQVLADGSTPHYRLTRIGNVCLGAEIRAVRTGEALPAFTAQACRGILAAGSAPAEAAGAAPSALPAEASAPAPVIPGLDEKTIAATVDAHWRSIGRDCMAVAPRSAPAAAAPSSAAPTGSPVAPEASAAPQQGEPEHTPVTVTIHVAPSGQVRHVSARVRGHDALESCIERSVRGWVFPSAERDTEVGLPLIFVGE